MSEFQVPRCSSGTHESGLWPLNRYTSKWAGMATYVTGNGELTLYAVSNSIRYIGGWAWMARYVTGNGEVTLYAVSISLVDQLPPFLQNETVVKRRISMETLVHLT